STRTTGYLRMEGREVFRHAVVKLAEAVDAAIAANSITGTDIDWLVPHQANQRIIDGMGHRLGLPPEKVVLTIDRHANTSAASIPLALAEATADGRIRPGHLVLMEAMGGGFTWGSALVRWGRRGYFPPCYQWIAHRPAAAIRRRLRVFWKGLREGRQTTSTRATIPLY